MKQRNENYMEISPRHFMIRLVTISMFIAIALTMYFLGFINFACVMLITLGALWNFFVPINTYVSFVFCLVVCFMYSSFAIVEGLYANAILYFLVYVVLQYLVWVLFSDDNTNIEDKQLSGNSSYFVICFIIIGFALAFAISIHTSKHILPLFDALSASMLGLSAFLQSFKYREYFVIRPIALILSIILWFFTGYENGFDGYSLTVMLMYIMYLVLDMIFIVFRINGFMPHKKQKVKDYQTEIKVNNKKAILKQINNDLSNKDGESGSIKA